MRSSRAVLVGAALLISTLPAAAQLPVDSSVYFWPDTKSQPIGSVTLPSCGAN